MCILWERYSSALASLDVFLNVGITCQHCAVLSYLTQFVRAALYAEFVLQPTGALRTLSDIRYLLVECLFFSIYRYNYHCYVFTVLPRLAVYAIKVVWQSAMLLPPLLRYDRPSHILLQARHFIQHNLTVTLLLKLIESTSRLISTFFRRTLLAWFFLKARKAKHDRSLHLTWHSIVNASL